jgi:hypothetical protein
VRDIVKLARKLAGASRTMKDLEAELPNMSDKAQDQLLHVLQDIDADRTRMLRRYRGIPGPGDKGGR